MTVYGVRPSLDSAVATTRSKSFPSDIHGESVYHLMTKIQLAVQKQPLYRSVYAGQARVEYKTNRKQAASMGPLKVSLEKPSQYLKSHTGESRLASAPKASQQRSHAQADRHLKLWESCKPKAVPKKLEQTHVSSTKKSTELDSYRDKKDYGRAPSYLKLRKEELKAVEEKKQLIAANPALAKFEIAKLPEEERLRILEGLKKNWTRLNTEYMKLSLVVDTVPKITRKITFEAQLKKMEEDIEKFSHPNIIIRL